MAQERVARYIAQGTRFVFNRLSGNTNLSWGATKFLEKGRPLHNVYFGIRGGERTYAGITKNMIIRARQHGFRFDRLERIGQNLTRGQARAIEQALIKRYGSGFENIRNSIDPRNPMFNELRQWGEAWLKKHGF